MKTSVAPIAAVLLTPPGVGHHVEVAIEWPRSVPALLPLGAGPV